MEQRSIFSCILSKKKKLPNFAKKNIKHSKHHRTLNTIPTLHNTDYTEHSSFFCRKLQFKTGTSHNERKKYKTSQNKQRFGQPPPNANATTQIQQQWNHERRAQSFRQRIVPTSSQNAPTPELSRRLLES